MRENNTNRIEQYGKDLIVRIPKEIEKAFKIKRGTRVKLHPETDKLIVEFKD